MGIVLVLLSAACATREEGAPTATSEAGEATNVDVALREWSVIPRDDSAPAGEIMFSVSNDGEDDHELMVVRTGLSLNELPTKDDGSFDEEGDAIEGVEATNAAEHEGEEHDVVEPGAKKEFMYELEEGSYVLLCNLVENRTESGETKTAVHFKLGMRIPFTVEQA
jgi:hypothetical protein